MQVRLGNAPSPLSLSCIFSQDALHEHATHAQIHTQLLGAAAAIRMPQLPPVLIIIWGPCRPWWRCWGRRR